MILNETGFVLIQQNMIGIKMEGLLSLLSFQRIEDPFYSWTYCIDLPAIKWNQYYYILPE